MRNYMWKLKSPGFGLGFEKPNGKKKTRGDSWKKLLTVIKAKGWNYHQGFHQIRITCKMKYPPKNPQRSLLKVMLYLHCLCICGDSNHQQRTIRLWECEAFKWLVLQGLVLSGVATVSHWWTKRVEGAFLTKLSLTEPPTMSSCLSCILCVCFLMLYTVRMR